MELYCTSREYTIIIIITCSLHVTKWKRLASDKSDLCLIPNLLLSTIYLFSIGIFGYRNSYGGSCFACPPINQNYSMLTIQNFYTKNFKIGIRLRNRDRNFRTALSTIFCAEYSPIINMFTWDCSLYQSSESSDPQLCT